MKDERAGIERSESGIDRDLTGKGDLAEAPQPLESARVLAEALLEWLRDPLAGCDADPTDKTFVATEQLALLTIQFVSPRSLWPSVERNEIAKKVGTTSNVTPDALRKRVEVAAVCDFVNSRSERLNQYAAFRRLGWIPHVKPVGGDGFGGARRVLQLVGIPLREGQGEAVDGRPATTQIDGMADSGPPACSDMDLVGVVEVKRAEGVQAGAKAVVKETPSQAELIVYASEVPLMGWIGMLAFGKNGLVPVRSVRGFLVMGKAIFWALLAILMLMVLMLSLTKADKQAPFEWFKSTALLGIFCAYAWFGGWRPWERLGDEKIIKGDDLWVKFKEDGCEIEKALVEDKPHLRVVRYFSTCGVCGGRVQLGKGGFEFHGKLVGRCRQSPREHVFSFDRATLKGYPLRQRKDGYVGL